MAIYLTAKTPGAAVSYTWEPPLAPGDSLISGTITVSSGTLSIESSEVISDGLAFFVSGGVAGNTVKLAATGTTQAGEDLTETIYLPIVSSDAQIADTARSYVSFALRKITGIGETPEADELDDALERLNDIVARWREGGADIGAPYPLTADTVIYCPDWAVSALRYNLLVECAPLYDYEPTAMEYELARRGVQLVKHKNLPVERVSEYF